MERKHQIMIGSGALVGLVGLYFAWNFYSKRSTENVKLVVAEKEPEKKEPAEKEQ
tara:strand:- start:1145 stop:1309 length:165 start_codon:yes stop_codon:yes gene_type:complete